MHHKLNSCRLKNSDKNNNNSIDILRQKGIAQNEEKRTEIKVATITTTTKVAKEHHFAANEIKISTTINKQTSRNQMQPNFHFDLEWHLALMCMSLFLIHRDALCA